jgi:hypothetical protein
MYEICEMRFRLGLFVRFMTQALAHSRRSQVVDVYEASFSTKRGISRFAGDEIWAWNARLLLFRTGRALAHNRREQVIDA